MNSQYLDIHTHPTKEFYGDEVADVLMRAKAADVRLVTVGTGLSDSREGVQLSEEHDHVFSIIGQHPTNTDGYNKEAFSELAGQSRVVGFGETGFDFFHRGRDDEGRQRDVFLEHIALALKHSKPLMLHVRPGKGSYDAYEAVYDVLSSHASQFSGEHVANLHFFAGTTEIAQKFLNLGCTVSFTGVVTFADVYVDLVRYVPLDRILSETDSPFVAPVPHRGKKNEPAYVTEIVRSLASIKGVAEQQMKDQIWSNANRLFGW